MLNNVIDLSHHNSDPDFRKARSNGLVGVIHKASQGRGFVDATYEERRARALASGLLWGAYHFGTNGNVAAQVRNFMEAAAPQESDLLVLDFEPDPEAGTMSLVEAEEFVQLVHKATGRYPGLYSGQSFLLDVLAGTKETVLSNCFLWIARYSSESPRIPKLWKSFTFWQYTDGNSGPQPHQLAGIGRCDRNKFNGSHEELYELWNVPPPGTRSQPRFAFDRRSFSATAIVPLDVGLDELVELKMEEVFRQTPGIPLPPKFKDVLGDEMGDYFTPDHRCQQVVWQVLNLAAGVVGYTPTTGDWQFIQENVSMKTKIGEAITIVLQILRQ